MITVNELVKDPTKVYRIGKQHPTPCACGQLTWRRECRKCHRKRIKKLRKQERRERKHEAQER
jgi:hypothetical protein